MMMDNKWEGNYKRRQLKELVAASAEKFEFANTENSLEIEIYSTVIHKRNSTFLKHSLFIPFFLFYQKKRKKEGKSANR